MKSIRKYVPTILIPFAWAVALPQARRYIMESGVLVMHVVMIGFLTFFLITGWQKMNDESVLNFWKWVIFLGLIPTFCGLIGVAAYQQSSLIMIDILGWAILPTAGMTYTGYIIQDKGQYIYYLSSVLSFVGVIILFLVLYKSLQNPSVGIALVCAGHTMGIIEAVVRNY